MTKHYVKDYPRPQLLREGWKNLNGRWDFSFDDGNVGLSKGWQNGFEKQHDIEVPFTYETKLSGIGDETEHKCVWYATKTELKADGGRLLLHFEGSDYHTMVWVNGQLAGEHTGGYARFSFDVTELAKDGENLIVVRVEDDFDDRQPRGKQRWKEYNYGCWYVQTTGIWKTVWVEKVPASYIKSLKLTPSLKDNTLLVEAEIEGEAKQLKAAASFDGKDCASALVDVKKGVAKLTLNIHNTEIYEWGVKAWSPESPDLYDLELSLDGGDTVFSYFGMREIEIRDRQVLLNGRPLYQRLILDQGYWPDSHLTPPSEEALVEDIDKILELGYNGLRKHQKTEDERFLYWCDVKGMLVWSEMAAAYTFDDYAVESFTREWMEIVRQNYSHPSIITWTPFNESWGVSAIRHDEAQQAFTQGIYWLTKAFDKMRPVIVNDGWEHTISDIITLHDYQEDGEVFLKKYTERIDEILSNEMHHNDFKFAFAEGFEYFDQPILISEYGGIAYTTDEGWGYGNQVRTEEDFLNRFEKITRAIQALDFVCGYCYTQVSHVQQERNGLMDEERNFVADSKRIAEINKAREMY